GKHLLISGLDDRTRRCSHGRWTIRLFYQSCSKPIVPSPHRAFGGIRALARAAGRSMLARIVVVGAGPTGTALSYLLARRGIEVVLLERETDFDRLFRGEGMMPCGIDALAQMGLRQHLEWLPSRRLDRWEFYFDGVPFLVQPEPDRERPNCVRIMSQPHLLRALVEEAQRFPSFRFEPGTTVRDFSPQADGGVVVRADTRAGPREFGADLLIGADGRSSVVRKRASIPLEPQPLGYDVVWWSLPLPSWLRDASVFYAFASSRTTEAAGAYPSWDGRLRLGWLIPKGTYRSRRTQPPDGGAAARRCGPPDVADPHAGDQHGPARCAGRRESSRTGDPGRRPWNGPRSSHPADRGGTDAGDRALAGAPGFQQQAVGALRSPLFRRFVLPVLGRLGLTRRIWLHGERPLRYGAVPVRLTV
ncbi:MAG: hypothetical protein E6J76_15335, partial [Deltaproteobacteria bacterium]